MTIIRLPISAILLLACAGCGPSSTVQRPEAPATSPSPQLAPAALAAREEPTGDTFYEHDVGVPEDDDTKIVSVLSSPIVSPESVQSGPGAGYFISDVSKIAKKITRAVGEAARDVGSELKIAHDKIRKELRRDRHRQDQTKRAKAGMVPETQIKYTWWREGDFIVIQFDQITHIAVWHDGSAEGRGATYIELVIKKGDRYVVRPGQTVFVKKDGDWLRVDLLRSKADHEVAKAGLVRLPFADLANAKTIISDLAPFGEFTFDMKDGLPSKILLGDEGKEIIELESMTTVGADNSDAETNRLFHEAWRVFGESEGKTVWMRVKGSPPTPHGVGVPPIFKGEYAFYMAPYIYPAWGQYEQHLLPRLRSGEDIVGCARMGNDNLIYTLIHVHKVQK